MPAISRMTYQVVFAGSSELDARVVAPQLIDWLIGVASLFLTNNMIKQIESHLCVGQVLQIFSGKSLRPCSAVEVCP